MPQTTDAHSYTGARSPPKKFESQTNTLSNIEEQIRIKTIAKPTTKQVCGYFFFLHFGKKREFYA